MSWTARKCFNARNSCTPPRKPSCNAVFPSRRVTCVLKLPGNVPPASTLIGSVCQPFLTWPRMHSELGTAMKTDQPSSCSSLAECVCVCHLLDLLLKVLSYSSLAECICGNSKRPTQCFRFDETITSSINHSCCLTACAYRSACQHASMSLQNERFISQATSIHGVASGPIAQVY
jgi:hypothetical protein